MRIALDYDNTYTLDPRFWNIVIQLAQRSNHEVHIVTMRSDTADRIEGIDFLPIHYCDGMPKKAFMKDNHNIEYDVWIDDTPEGIHMGSSFTPEQLEEWRVNGRV